METVELTTVLVTLSIAATSVGLASIVYFGIRRLKTKKKPTPIYMGKHKVYLRDDEMETWKSLSRTEKRNITRNYEKMIKKGELYPVKQPNGDILYAQTPKK